MTAHAEPHGEGPFLSSHNLASLSDTIFGVAMTLLPTTLLPSLLTQKGSGLSVLRDMSGSFTPIALGFAISASYWIVQQRRLAVAISVTPLQAVLNLFFLFLIVLLPISTGIWGRSGMTLNVVLVYGTHLTLIAVVNLLLWLDVHRGAAAHAQIVRSSMALALFVLALGLGAMWPFIAEYLWLAVFATTLVNGKLARLFYAR